MNIEIPVKTLAVLGGLILVIVLGVFTFRSSPPSPLPKRPVAPAQTSIPQKNEETSQQVVGGVEVSVTHDPKSSPSMHRFTVSMTTHSGDLSTFDAQENILYRPATGDESKPSAVQGDLETHHRTIVVTYTDTSFPGMLVIKNLRGIPEQLFPFTN